MARATIKLTKRGKQITLHNVMASRTNTVPLNEGQPYAIGGHDENGKFKLVTFDEITARQIADLYINRKPAR